MTTPTRDRAAHDPFAPRRPDFPRDRFRRSGLPAEAMDHLQDRYDDMPEEQATRWAQRIRQQSGTAIRSRFTLPEGSPQEVREALEGMTQAQLRDLAAAEGLHLSGTNEDLRDRLAGTETPVTPVEPQPATPDLPTPEPQPQPAEPVEPDPDAEQAEVEVTRADGTTETVTGTLPTDTAAPPTQEIPAQAPAPRPRTVPRSRG